MITIATWVLALATFQQSDAQLLTDLASDDLVVRLVASREIFLRGRGIIPDLLKLEKSADSDLRPLVHGLLVDLGHPPALVGELKSDDTPGNAKQARVALIRNYDASVRDLLLDAVKSDDDQQAIQAAFILGEKGESAAVLKAAPALVSRSCAAFVRAESHDYFWVAARVMLRLNSLLPDAERESAIRKAIRGVPPDALHDDVRDLAKIAREFKLPFPEPILDRYLENLKADRIGSNAHVCRYSAKALAEFIVPPLRRVLVGRDAQARQIACGMLLGLDVTELPFEVLAETMGEDPRARKLLEEAGDAAIPALENEMDHGSERSQAVAAEILVSRDRDRYAVRAVAAFRSILRKSPSRWLARDVVHLIRKAGKPAEALLEEMLQDGNPHFSLEAGAGLLDLDLDLPRFTDKVMDVAIANLECDSHYGNADAAAGLLSRIGAHALPALRRGLASDDEQVVTWSACILRRLGSTDVPTSKALDQMQRFAFRGWSKDEDSGMIELFSKDEALWKTIRTRLQGQWALGANRIERIEILIQRAR